MSNPDRLTGLDASFLALEDGVSHMHVGSCSVLRGGAPRYADLLGHIDRRLALVPRYRQKLATVPFEQHRPIWVDDPHFNLGYHVRHSALPSPGGIAELRTTCGRVFSQELDRAKPLWELWLVEGLVDEDGEEGGFALISKTHHCLVDGISGVDIGTVLFDPGPESAPVAAGGHQWLPRPEPSPAQLLAQALSERAAQPLDLARGVARAISEPERALASLGRTLQGVTAMARASLDTAPHGPLNVPIGPHRRFTWVTGDLTEFKAIKGKLGGTVNDVVLTAVTGALRGFMLRRQVPVDGLTLKAMVPVSVRAEAERGALGNRVTTMYAPLPVHAADPLERFRIVHTAMDGLKESGQAVGAEVLTRLTGFAPPTVMAQAARLQSRQRFFNVTVTNVPGPQFPLYLLGRKLEAAFPQVPLTRTTALGIAILSYNGRIDFGLLGDFDALPDLDVIADELRAAIAELRTLAGLDGPPPKRNGARRPGQIQPV